MTTSNWQPKIFYIGEKNSFEEKLCLERNIRFYGIYAGKFRRYFDIKNALDIFKISVGIFQAYWILKHLKPHLVFSKGGYVSLPVVLAARFLKIPLWIHESDATPGLATKFASLFAQKIFLAFEESKKFFPEKNREVIGNPIRREVRQGMREEGYGLTGFSKTLPVVLVMGGSSGARSLNELVYKILPQLLKKAQVVHVTGNRQLVTGNWGERYRAFQFLDGKRLAHCYAVADVVISRAGSGSIFEVLAIGKPLLLIPLPKSASRGDQIENAEIFEKHGWALSMYEEKISPQEFLEKIKLLLYDKKLQKFLCENQKKANFRDAGFMIAEAIKKFPKTQKR